MVDNETIKKIAKDDPILGLAITLKNITDENKEENKELDVKLTDFNGKEASKEEFVNQIVDTIKEDVELNPLVEIDNTEQDIADTLLEKYTELDLEISKVVLEQEQYRKENKAVFDKMKEYEDKIAKIEQQQEAVKGDLKTKMRELNKKEIVGIRFTAKYTAPYTRKKFDTDQFYKDYSEDTAMYKKYVSTTNVSESIKISENKKK